MSLRIQVVRPPAAASTTHGNAVETSEAIADAALPTKDANAMNDSGAGFGEFQERVAASPQLFAELAKANERDEFAAQAVKLGAGLGYRFGIAEVHAALTAARCAWLQRNVG
ncbi:MAG TPA: hypothetical protein VG710_08370 [Opitutus sp.]|nr:hypothetical protein [Opitutus sp.]